MYIFLGHSWQRLRLESAATATAKAHDTSTAAGRHAYSGRLALLCRGRTFNIDRHLESTRSAFTKSAHLVSKHHKITYKQKLQSSPRNIKKRKKLLFRLRITSECIYVSMLQTVA